MRKTYKYRLYPTAAQITALEKQLGKACRLYSAAFLVHLVVGQEASSTTLETRRIGSEKRMHNASNKR